jgi:hypothetical protein
MPGTPPSDRLDHPHTDHLDPNGGSTDQDETVADHTDCRHPDAHLSRCSELLVAAALKELVPESEQEWVEGVGPRSRL